MIVFAMNLPPPKSVILTVKPDSSQKCSISGELTAVYLGADLSRVRSGLVTTKAFIVSSCSNSSTVYESGLGAANKMLPRWRSPWMTSWECRKQRPMRTCLRILFAIHLGKNVREPWRYSGRVLSTFETLALKASETMQTCFPLGPWCSKESSKVMTCFDIGSEFPCFFRWHKIDSSEVSTEVSAVLIFTAT